MTRAIVSLRATRALSRTRSNRRKIECHLGQRKEPQHADRIVQHGENGAHRQFEREPHQHVDQDQHQGRHECPRTLDEQLLPDLGTHDLGALQLHALVHAAEHLEDVGADLIALGIRIGRQPDQNVA